jgi:hypothetical protein
VLRGGQRRAGAAVGTSGQRLLRPGINTAAGAAVLLWPGAEELLGVLDRDLNAPPRCVALDDVRQGGRQVSVARARSWPTADCSRISMAWTGREPKTEYHRQVRVSGPDDGDLAVAGHGDHGERGGGGSPVRTAGRRSPERRAVSRKICRAQSTPSRKTVRCRRALLNRRQGNPDSGVDRAESARPVFSRRPRSCRRT